MTAGLAGVVLAAGAGSRLRPLTGSRPKALCPVGNRPLLDHALDRLAPLAGSGPQHVAVNAHHHADLVAEHVGGRATVSREEPVALGTAGALGALRDWLDGRDVALTNADLWTPSAPADLAEGWDRERCRLLCVPADSPGDFTVTDGNSTRYLRYVGMCLVPWALVAGLAAEPSGLYEVLWRDAAARGDLDLAHAPGPSSHWVDCGTPRDYLAANLLCARLFGAPDAADASSTSLVDPTATVAGTVTGSVVGAGAQVRGRVHECVVWDGARVRPGEVLSRVVRAATDAGELTVEAA